MTSTSAQEPAAVQGATVTLRDATADDVDFLAWVMLAASRSHLARGIWEYFIDGDEDTTRRYLAALATTDVVHLFHHSLFVVAEVDGQPAAAMCGYDHDTQGFATFASALPGIFASGIVTIDGAELMRRGAVLQDGLPAVEVPNPWVIENVATKPEFRRRGLVDALLTEMIERGRARGYTMAQIGVLIGNEPARRAYLKAGFDVAAEKRSPEFEAEVGCPGGELLLRPI